MAQGIHPAWAACLGGVLVVMDAHDDGLHHGGRVTGRGSCGGRQWSASPLVEIVLGNGGRVVVAVSVDPVALGRLLPVVEGA